MNRYSFGAVFFTLRQLIPKTKSDTEKPIGTQYAIFTDLMQLLQAIINETMYKQVSKVVPQTAPIITLGQHFIRDHLTLTRNHFYITGESINFDSIV